MLPQSYPNYKTVHRRFQTWCRDEVLLRPGGSLQTGTNTLRLVLQSRNITDYWIDWLRVEPELFNASL